MDSTAANFKMARDGSYTDPAHTARSSSPLLFICGEENPALVYWQHHLVDISNIPMAQELGALGAVHCTFANRWLGALATTADPQLLAACALKIFLTAPAATLLFAKFLALNLPLRPWEIPELRVFLSKPDSPAEKHPLSFTDFGKCQTRTSANSLMELHVVQYFLVDSFATKNSSLAAFFDFQADLAPFHLQADRDSPLSPFRCRLNQMLLSLKLSGSERTAQYDADCVALAYTAHAPLPFFLQHFDPTPENESERRKDCTRRMENSAKSPDERCRANMEDDFDLVIAKFFPELNLIFRGESDTHFQQFSTLVLSMPGCSSLQPFIPSTMEAVIASLHESGLMTIIQTLPADTTTSARISLVIRNSTGISTSADGTPKNGNESSAQLMAILNNNASAVLELSNLLASNKFDDAFTLAFTKLRVVPVIQSMTGIKQVKCSHDLFLHTGSAVRYFSRFIGRILMRHPDTGVIPDYLLDWAPPQPFCDALLKSDWNRIDFENDLLNLVDGAIHREKQPKVNDKYKDQARLQKLNKLLGAIVVALGGTPSGQGSFNEFLNLGIGFLSDLPSSASAVKSSNLNHIQEYISTGLEEISRPFIDAMKSSNPNQALPYFILAPGSSARHVFNRAVGQQQLVVSLKYCFPEFERIMMQSTSAAPPGNDRKRPVDHGAPNSTKRGRHDTSGGQSGVVPGSMKKLAITSSCGKKIAISGDPARARWFDKAKVESKCAQKGECPWVAMSNKPNEVAAIFCPNPAHHRPNAPEHNVSKATRDAVQLFRL